MQEKKINRQHYCSAQKLPTTMSTSLLSAHDKSEQHQPVLASPLVSPDTKQTFIPDRFFSPSDIQPSPEAAFWGCMLLVN